MVDHNLQNLINEALETGNWMLRRSNGGKSYNGFQWEPIGEWTTAPDWDPDPIYGGGLHGVGPQSRGYVSYGGPPDIDFCLTDGTQIETDDDEIKCQSAMILTRNHLPAGLRVWGCLDLENTKITALPKNLQVRLHLDLRGTPIAVLPEDLQVWGYLSLRRTRITTLPNGFKVGGSLYLENTPIAILPDGLQVGGDLDLRGTQITVLPKDLKVGGEIYADEI